MSASSSSFVPTIVTALGLLAACGGDTPTSPDGESTRQLRPVAAGADWTVSTPGDEGFDSARLTDIVREIDRGRYGAVHSLLIARDDRLLLEEYFAGWNANAAHTMQSVTKSVTSLAVGIAVDRGLLRLEDRAVSFFPDYEPVARLDDAKRALAVRDLISMQSGLDWDENNYSGSPLERLNNCGCDWIRFVLDWPMREPPGSRWEYISGNTILLGAIVGRATGMRLDLFLDEALFSAMGFRAASWFRGLPDGLPHSGGGLSLRPRDMLKLGALVGSRGRWRGAQLVSSTWIDTSTRPFSGSVRSFAGRPATYTYGWWGLPDGVIAASGARGQWIFIVPSSNLIVSTTAEDAVSGGGRILDLLYMGILPAVR